MVEMPTGNMIKAARALAGLTARELATKAQIDPSSLSRLERSGSTAVSGRVLKAVIDALRAAHVEIESDTVLRLLKKPRR
jgi:transcriptional regulator with XRE-family HTH domain